jgi:hypothetical protein
LVCLVAARDLRREKLGLGRGLSWEATLDDLRLALDTNPAAKNLLGCRHLIVTFSSEGALWLERRNGEAPRARVCLDPARAEGEWAALFEGEVIGFHCAMAAAMAIGLAAHTDARRSDPKAVLDLLPAIEAGLLAMCDLAQYGHGSIGEELPTGFPAARIAGKILDVLRGGEQDATERLARVEIAWRPNPALLPPIGALSKLRSRLSAVRSGAV